MLQRRYFLFPILFISALFAAWVASLWRGLPDPTHLATVNPQTTSFIQQACPDCRIEWTPLSQLPVFVPQAVMMGEDPRFLQHHGFDWINIGLALRANLVRGKIVWGGSSITQQLAKNLYLTSEKTFGRKWREILLTIRLERSLSKARILEIYINVAQWGPRVFGITAAAPLYFQKSASELGPLESAYLVSILPNPMKAGDPQWHAHFAQAGALMFDQLVNAYLPPMGAVAVSKDCRERLSPEEAGKLDYLVAKIFGVEAVALLSGSRAIWWVEEWEKLLSREDLDFVNALLNRARKLRQVRPVECARAEGHEEMEPLEDLVSIKQNDLVVGQVEFWVPSEMEPKLKALLAKAESEGVFIKLTSAYRSAPYQTYLLLTLIRQYRYCVTDAMAHVALPEESEHGCADTTAVDFGGDPGIPFEQSRAYSWLQKHAAEFGFHLSYPENNPHMAFEPWHWRWGP